MNGYIKPAKAHAARVRERQNLRNALIAICLICISIACKQKQPPPVELVITKTKDEYPIRVDIRWGYKYFSLRANENGKAFVRKGRSSFFTKELITSPSDSVIAFRLDSIAPLCRGLNKLRTKPAIKAHVNTDSPRAEVYYANQKVLDASMSSSVFLDMYSPVISQLPSGFNPFFANEHPFD